MRCAKADRAAPPAGARGGKRKAGFDQPVRCLLAFGLILSGAPSAYAAAAGTVVSNTASLSFGDDDAVETVPSNTVDIILAERLDVAVTADVPTAPVIGGPIIGTSDSAVGFRVANRGNGAEAFTLIAGAKGDNASVIQIAADENDDGIYDPKIDRQLSSLQLALDPGVDAHVFVLVGGVTGNADISLAAAAQTGTGAPGTLFDGRGQGGGDAVVGQTGATAIAHTLLIPADQQATLTKSQTIAAPDGSARPVKGAVVTYKLEARFGAPAEAVEIEDPIPAGTAYVPGSLTLDGAALSDSDDDDQGSLRAGTIKVELGDIARAAVRTIRFQVTIQ